MNKKQIEAKIVEFDSWYLDGPLDELVEHLKEIQAKYGPGLKITYESGDYYTQFEVSQVRDETDKEFQTRLEAEERQHLYAEQNERNKYEELKKKFG